MCPLLGGCPGSFIGGSTSILKHLPVFFSSYTYQIRIKWWQCLTITLEPIAARM